MIQQQQENLPGEALENATSFPEPFAATAFPKPDFNMVRVMALQCLASLAYRGGVPLHRGAFQCHRHPCQFPRKGCGIHPLWSSS